MSGECNICGARGCVETKHTASWKAKAAGIKSLSAVSELTGVSLQTLTNWHKNKPMLFAVVLAGCVSIKDSNK